jgi:hypothetical protein
MARQSAQYKKGFQRLLKIEPLETGGSGSQQGSAIADSAGAVLMSFTAAPNQYVNQWTTLVTEQCYSCHVVFAMPKDLQDRALNDRSISFWCPKGHSQHYTSDKIKTLETQLQRAREEAVQESNRRRAAEQERDHHWIERKKITTRLRHLRVRVKNGVCPCCHRTFKQLVAHIALKHPGFAKEEDSK